MRDSKKTGNQSGYLMQLKKNQLTSAQTLYALPQMHKATFPPYLSPSLLIVMSRVGVYAGNFPQCLLSEMLQAKNVVLTVCSGKGHIRSDPHEKYGYPAEGPRIRVSLCCQASGKYTDRSAGISLLNSSWLQSFPEVRGADVWLPQPDADPRPPN